MNIRKRLKNTRKVYKALMKDVEFIEKLEWMIEVCCESVKDGGKIVFAGNGGSFAEAQHLSAELTGSFYNKDRGGYASICLGSNGATLTALSNDKGYDNALLREYRSLRHKSDVVIVLTTSGNSKNIVNLVEGVWCDTSCYAFTGRNDSVLNNVLGEGFIFRVPSDDVAIIQEAHLAIGHMLCQGIEERLG